MSRWCPLCQRAVTMTRRGSGQGTLTLGSYFFWYYLNALITQI